MTTTLDVFISSKMLELKPERDALYDLLPTLDYGDIQLRAWVFEEDAPATSRSIREVYLNALQNAALYIGLFWKEYGEWTIDEFDRATEWGMERHIYVKDVDADQRAPQLKAFLDKHGDVPTGITAKWFKTTNELCEAVKKSIEVWITERLRSRPGGTSALFAGDADDLTERPRKLIGRDDLLHDVGKLLDGGERVLLQGFGGMGKTALAAVAAGEWIAAGKGAALWLRCGSASADALFEALARPFNAQQVIAREYGDAKIQIVRQLLRQSGAKLLVLDDCWNGPALFTILKAAPSNMPVLVTARQRYALDNLLDVGELKPDDALSLLLYHSKGEATDDARALCRALGNHAFTVEIAGKTLKARKWQPAELLAAIKDAPHDLRTPADFNENERRSVKDLLDASVNILTDEEKAVFFAFGAFFAPQLTAEMLKIYLASVGTTHASSALATTLASLEIHGLVEHIPATDEAVEYFRVHDLAYSYAGAQATDAHRNRALDAALAYTERYNEPNLANFAALRPELDNLLGASHYTFALDDYKTLRRFAANLNTTAGSNILDFQGFYSQAISLLLMGLESSRKRGNQDDEGIWLGHLGIAYFSLGDYPRAIDYHQQALAISRHIGDKQGEGSHLGNLGSAYFSLGDYPRAIDHYEQALAISRQIGDRRGEGSILGNLGSAYARLGDYPRAIDHIDHYEQALAIARHIGDKRGEGNRLGNLGIAYASLGDYPRAIDHYEQALAISRQIGDKQGEGNGLGNLGSAYFSLGDYPRAIDHYEQALAIARHIGDKRGEGSHLGSLGSAYASLGDYPRAIDHYEQALAISRQIGDKQGEGNGLGNLGSAYASLGDYPRAIDHYEQALAIARHIGDRRGEGSHLGNLGLAYASLGDYPRAIDFYEQARAIFEGLGLPHEVKRADARIAEAQAKLAESAGGGGAGQR